MVQIRKMSLVTSLMLISGASAVQADSPVALPYDTPTMVEGVEIVCTGIGQEARSDPRWSTYPLKVVIAGEDGQYLGDAQMNVAGKGESMMDVRCGGPWVLFKLDPGRYTVTAMVNGSTVKTTADVASSGQGRVILRFPTVGGVVSAEHKPAME